MWRNLLIYKTKESQYVVKAISVLEIGGGALGLLLVAFQFLRSFPAITNYFFISFITLLLLSLYFLIAYAGFQLWKNSYQGYRLSILAQAIQLPFITTHFFYYMLNSVFGVYLISGSLGSQINYVINSTFRLGFITDDPTAVGLNIFALSFLIYLIVFYRKNKSFLKNLVK